MFTGIVSECQSILQVKTRDQVLEIIVTRPHSFQNIQTGDSVAVDGVCLTIEHLTSQSIQFALALDTLQTTKWNPNHLLNKKVNLEPSLKIGDSIGGHFVTGHIDGMAVVKEKTIKGENQLVTIEIPPSFKQFLWKKGFLTINGVSLTIQEVRKENQVRLGLIPETLKRTNLHLLEAGILVTFEVSYLARALWHYFKHDQKLFLK